VNELFAKLRDLCGANVEPVYGEAKAGDLARSLLDPSAAKAHLGWEAWTSLDEGLAATVDYFRSHG
jgi:UDP-glucose 4-epimerase